MIIFLDFDGVLHPRPNDWRGKFCHLERLERVLREYPNVQLVISSSWRDTYPLDVITALFSDDIQPRILGTTPLGDGEKPYSRFEEIKGWLRQSGHFGAWLALDDAVAEFPVNTPQLVPCITSVGFDDQVARLLVSKIKANC